MQLRIWVLLVFLGVLRTSAGESADKAAAFRDEATGNLLVFLQETARSGRFLFGQANALTLRYQKPDLQRAPDGSSDLRAVAGVNPAFVESDLMWHAEARANDLAAMREAFRLGIVCGYCWHMRGQQAPEFSLLPGGEANRPLARAILASPDRARNPALDWFLREYETKAIPVFRELGFPLVFRPLHEMNGDWFWWGSACCTPEEYIRLYRLVVTHLRAQGVRNLLFAWSPDKIFDLRYYPGDEYVDIVGLDAYEPGVVESYPATAFAEEVKKLASYAAAHGKVAALTETGCRTGYPGANSSFWSAQVLPPVLSAGGIAYVMAWYNADWNRDGTGRAYTPYPGIESHPGGAEARADFLRFLQYANLPGQHSHR